MSVNRSLTFINTKQTVNTGTLKLSVSSEDYDCYIHVKSLKIEQIMTQSR